MSDNRIVIDGTLIWAKVHKPDERYPMYSTEFQPLNDTELSKLKAAGLKPSTKKDGTKVDQSAAGFAGDIYKAKRKLVTGKGVPLSPPVVTDANNVLFKEPLGNGTVARIHGSTYKTPTGEVMLGFDRIQVIKFVPYTKGEFAPAPIEGGFSADTVLTGTLNTSNKEII